MITGIICRAMW